MKYFTLVLIAFLFACSGSKKVKTTFKPVSQDTIKYQKPQTLSITGDFDGDGRQDQLLQIIADSTGKRVDKIIDFQSYDIYDVAKYFDKYNLHTKITVNDTETGINTGYACGLLCLINIGDNNRDNKDEIAIVPDLMDFSRANSCRIYSLCSSGWEELFSFNVHEGAFDYTGDIPPVFKNIPEALEYKNGKWHYLDYLEMDYETAEEVGQMKPIIIGSCQK